jgi:MFS family permease
LLVLGPFALGYFLSYLFRAVNAVVAPNLVSDIGLTAGQLGLLTSAYLFAFAVFQLPLGVLLDRFGPRRVQAALLCCAAVGSLLFSTAEGATTLTAARALIGLGFAGGLMSGFKAVVLWVPEPRRALANACVMSFGALGILVATVPVEIAVQAVPCRNVRRPRRAKGSHGRSAPSSGSTGIPRSGGWRPCWRPAPGRTSASRLCGPVPGSAMSPASTGAVWQTT